MVTDYNGDASRLTDLARNTIVTDSESLARVAGDLEEAGARVKVVDAALDELGYSGILAKPRTRSRLVAEIQANTPAMIYANEPEESARSIIGDQAYDEIARRTGQPGGLGHKLYEEWRTSIRTSARAQEIAAQSREYYSHFR